MDINDEAVRAAQLAEARYSLPEAVEALGLLAIYAGHQLDALLDAGLLPRTAERIVAQWWSDTIRDGGTRAE